MQKSPYVYPGADVSYFSGKVRPALPHKNLWYREVTPNMKEIVGQTSVAFAALSDADRMSVDAALGGTGWESLLTLRPRHRTRKLNNELALES